MTTSPIAKQNGRIRGRSTSQESLEDRIVETVPHGGFAVRHGSPLNFRQVFQPLCQDDLAKLSVLFPWPARLDRDGCDVAGCAAAVEGCSRST